MSNSNDNNSLTLSMEEQRVLYYWRQGYTMKEAYKTVMLTKHEQIALNDLALTKRVQRFFNTFRMRAAMAATPGERGEKARQDFEKWKALMKVDESEQPEQEPDYSLGEEEDEYNRNLFKGMTLPKMINVTHKSDKEIWIDSLNVNKSPSAMTVYGSGQFLMYTAIKEIMDRQKEIKAHHISPLDKRGSALTPQIISAIKTAAMMILPFAPAPTEKERKDMTKAAILLGLVSENIKVNPDDYTAPIPSTVDVTEEDGEDND